tara:strand:- start:1416 stop:1766 length:351 start_codon:yes stop_codon:yes gene_type:complete
MSSDKALQTTEIKSKQNEKKGKHKSHRVRQATLMSYAELLPTLPTRNRQVFEAFKEGGPATDREIKKRIGFDDMNMVRPRITALIEDGLLEEIAKIRCDTTNRLVRLVAIAKDVRP